LLIAHIIVMLVVVNKLYLIIKYNNPAFYQYWKDKYITLYEVHICGIFSLLVSLYKT